MIIVGGVSYLLPAGKRVGTAQLAGIREHLFEEKNNVYFNNLHTI